MLKPETNDRLRPWERWAVILLFVLITAFGVLVEIRSAFLERRMGDLGVFLRAGWAVRAGQNMYEIMDDNLWHYSYPPIFAILMAPLADPPHGVEASGYVPYAASVGIAYAFNILCLMLAVHWLASALERASGLATRRFSRRWWILRTTPVFVCLTTIGHTLNRGQTNLIVLMLLSGLIAGLMNGHRIRAGLCLAGAICIKIFPAFLLLVPLWRRDGRCLAGCMAGLLLGLVLIPGAVLGPRRTVDAYQELAHVLIGPALGMGSDKSRAEELIDTTATDNQSFQFVIQATLYPNRDTRPHEASTGVKALSLGLGALLTVLTLAAGRGGRAAGGPGLALFAGCLTLIMLLLSPVCHSHYFCMQLPLVMALLAVHWRQRPFLTGSYLGSGLTSPVNVPLFVLFAALFVTNVLPHLPDLFVLRDRGVATLGTLLLWVVSWQALRSLPGEQGSAAVRLSSQPLAA